MTYNFIVNAKTVLFAGTTLADTGMRILIKRVGNMKALVEPSIDGIKVIIPTFTKLANALTESKYMQISLFDCQMF